MNYKIVRVSSGDNGTFGVFLCDGVPFCVTLEDPWNDNKTGVSCIPAGTYQASRHNGQKYQNVWQLLNVPKRSAILIHQGNTIEDTRGCILVGNQFGKVNGKHGIINSRLTLDVLRNKLPDNFELEIIGDNT